MSESLLGRVARLVSGTFTSLMDAAENAAPELVVRQAIEELSSAMSEVRAEIGRKQAARHNANRELSSLNERAETLKTQIQLALQQSRSDLAEAGTSELIGIEDRIPLIEGLVVSSQEEEQELVRYLSGLSSKKEEMQRDFEAIKERANKTGTSSNSPGDGGQDDGTDNRVEKAMDAVARVKASATGMPGSSSGVDTKARGELEDLHRRNRIAERLEALKKGS